jgi:GNAT superfamily N-acetyltransferase
VASDVPAVMDLLMSSFAGYSEFAPPGWVPPTPADEDPEMIGKSFDNPEVWYVVAEDGAGHAGQCGFCQAYTEARFRGEPIEGMAHFWQLFIRPDMWGTGLAGELHAAALDEIRARGFARARLWTPEGQARARRFYERRGWVLGEERQDDGPFGIPLVMYLHELR